MSLNFGFNVGVILRSHPEIEISFKLIPKILMSKECIHFLGHSVYICIYIYIYIYRERERERVFLEDIGRISTVSGNSLTKNLVKKIFMDEVMCIPRQLVY